MDPEGPLSDNILWFVTNEGFNVHHRHIDNQLCSFLGKEGTVRGYHHVWQPQQGVVGIDDLLFVFLVNYSRICQSFQEQLLLR